jgi:hypothetical protein
VSGPGVPHAVTLTGARLRRLHEAGDERVGNAHQEHGFVFESGMCNLMGLWTPPSYTAKWDAYDREPARGTYPDPYSFKNVNITSNIELGSLKRQANITCDFHLYVSFWSGNGLNMKRVHVMDVPGSYWHSLWPENITPFLAHEAFKGITNSKDDDTAWNSRLVELKQAWADVLPKDSPMKVHFKRDHGTQKRVQCSVGKKGFNELFQLTYDPVKTAELEGKLGP